MSCACSSKAIVATSDQRFESNPDGSAVTYYLGAETWQQFAGARSVLHHLTILAMEGTTPVFSVIAQGSSDGKSWFDIAGMTAGPFGTGDMSTAANPKRALVVPSAVTPLPPLVRFGVKVSASAALGAIRLTWVIEARSGHGAPSLATAGTATNPASGAPLGSDPYDLLGELDLIVTAGSSLTVADIDIETSASAAVGSYFRAATISLAAGATGTVKATNLLRYARVVNRTAAITTINWALSAFAR